jgi:hypothetical protein
VVCPAEGLTRASRGGYGVGHHDRRRGDHGRPGDTASSAARMRATLGRSR